ncbi:hypothetical protein ICN11_08415 [Polynucleobacter sp. 78F-HAINBA]|uniref:hypothetical protein n=1 Tax=Polynucleobacter sp. 78F-HAINBA TaxID=2689099 RepID=UPI001C0D6C67|nr:hypothetical protein [Polynucleobacter sp. 78F-HAINBA]MBU3592038.1 hypothetical protein [Polynucleobacter sp. 78F-HAINBA]
MAEDRLRRGAIQSAPKKQVEPFIQIPSEVLNSSAYIDLSYAARAALIEILHFYRGNNNGSIWISSETVAKRGFSKNTMTRAVKELIAHGMIYQTRRGGNLSGVCNLYAITWKRINKAEGQFLNQFVSYAYQNWKSSVEKNEGSKIGRGHPKNWECRPKKLKFKKPMGTSGGLVNAETMILSFPNIGSYLDMPYIQQGKPMKIVQPKLLNIKLYDQKELEKSFLVTYGTFAPNKFNQDKK